MEEGNAESEEESPFPSGFGRINSDTDDSTDIESNTEEQKIIGNESASKPKQDNANNEEMSNIKGKYIIQ